MKIERLPGWRGLLTDYVVETAHEPFRPGKSDCALWTAGAVNAMTGVDIARGLRGYRSIAEGLRAAKAKGYDSHVAVFAAHLEEIPPAMAGVGDVAVLADDAIGIVQGELIYVPTPTGRGRVPLTDAMRAFRV